MLDWALTTLHHLGYLGLFALMALENIFPPIPSEAIMPLAGLAAARGQFTLPGVILVGVAGSVIGNLPLYLIGRRIGERRVRTWIAKHGRWLLLDERDVDRATRWFARYGRSAVLLGRLVPGVRSLVSLPAGCAGMPAPAFIGFTVAGSGAWCGLLAAIGFWFSDYIEALGRWVDIIGWSVLGLVALLLAVSAIRRFGQAARRS